MYVYETRERTRHEHSTLHTSIQYVHNVALTRAHRHEHVDVALQLRAVSTLHTWHKVTHLPRISPPPRNMASSPSLLAWPDRGGRAACRGHGCDTLHTTPCTPCCPVAQPLRSPPPPPTHPLPPLSPHPCPRAAASRAELLEVLRRCVELCDEPRVLLAQPRLVRVRVWVRVRV
mgnify:CR=1 FL=1